ncbi:hypothetical protein COOONC_05578, partial [Cooperia oncophora]
MVGRPPSAIRPQCSVRSADIVLFAQYFVQDYDPTIEDSYTKQCFVDEDLLERALLFQRGGRIYLLIFIPLDGINQCQFQPESALADRINVD